jgi:hypothetical protein
MEGLFAPDSVVWQHVWCFEKKIRVTKKVRFGRRFMTKNGIASWPQRLSFSPQHFPLA